MSNPHRGPSKDAFYQFSVYLGKQFQRKRLLDINQPKNKNGLWRPCLLTDRNLMPNIYSGQSEHASYQVSIHLFKRFQRRFLYKWPIRNKNCLWRPCLLMDRDEMSNLHRGPSIDACDQVSVDLDEGLQRKIIKSEQLMDDRRRTTDAKWWQQLKMHLILYRFGGGTCVRF
jgi:hypothetical protein